jgi:hypothetical protein
MCNIDQGWPLAYFQVAVSILIFGVGLPSLVLQAIVPEDLREVVYRHFRLLRWSYFLFIPLMTLIVMIFVWIIHPCDNTQLIHPGFWSKYNLSGLDEIIITFSVSLLLLGWWLQVLYRRDRLINQLMERCKQRIQKKKNIEAQILDDIRYLGEKGKARGSKFRILEIFERLAYKVQSQEGYHGNELEDIIQVIEFTIQKDTDAVSFVQGISTLKHILDYEPKSSVDSSTDTGTALRALQRLGAIAITMDNERPTRKILETVESISRSPNGVFSEAALALFELGAASLEHGRFLVAVETLSRLEAMICRKEPVNAANSAAYLGLVAHFWSKGGSARRRALSGLKGIKFTPSRSKCLKSAQQSFYGTARFTTADLLSEMSAKL